MNLWSRRIAQDMKEKIENSYFGQFDDFMYSFLNLLTFSW